MCALNGLVHIPSPLRGEGKGEGLSNCLKKATNWLKSIQHSDGGFSESPETYRRNIYAPYPNPNGIKGVYSQTAWALMGLIAGGEASSGEAIRAAQFLSNGLGQDGQWDEKEYTGTGFPLHFYIRYHGYRHFFPLLALAEFYRTYTQEKIKG
jgi:squalene-hopene/tetraprenyl-beta-curcumene cyclase